MKKYLYFLVFSAVFISTVSRGQAIQQVGFYTINGIFALDSKPNYMILGNGDLVDISNPAMPILNGNFSINGFCTAVLSDSDYVYFGTGMSVKLLIADISNPSLPLQTGSIDFPQLNGGIFGIAKKADVLYLAAGDNGLYSIDISDKSNPVVLDSLLFANGQSRDVAVVGSNAYIAHYDGLKVVDITDPSNLVYTNGIGSGYYSIDISNNLAFLGKDSGGVDVFDITNPSMPVPAFSILNSGGTAWDIKCRGNLVYVATNSSGLFIYKVQNNSAQQMANFANTGNGQSFCVALSDSLIFLSGLINGVAILQYDSLGTVGINSEPELNSFEIFPNPSSESYINIFQKDFQKTNFEMINTTGSIVRSAICYSKVLQVDVADLPAGVYLINLRNKDVVVQKKYIRIKQ